MALYSISTGDVIRVSVFQRLFDQVIINRLNYFYSGDTLADGPFALSALLTNLLGGGAWPTVMLARQSHNLHHDFIQAQKVYPTRWSAVKTISNQDGGQGEDSLPSNVDLIVNLTTGFADRRGLTGRMFLGGIVPSFVVGDDVSAAGFTALNTLGNALKQVHNAGADNLYTPIILSKAGGALGFRNIIDYYPNPYARVMHRRTKGIGI